MDLDELHDVYTELYSITYMIEYWNKMAFEHTSLLTVSIIPISNK
jgi:hypothetical protein